MLIKPAPGLIIRDPLKHDLIPETGREVNASDPYWIRRLKDGDVVRAEPPITKPTLNKKGA